MYHCQLRCHAASSCSIGCRPLLKPLAAGIGSSTTSCMNVSFAATADQAIGLNRRYKSVHVCMTSAGQASVALLLMQIMPACLLCSSWWLSCLLYKKAPINCTQYSSTFVKSVFGVSDTFVQAFGLTLASIAHGASSHSRVCRCGKGPGWWPRP